MVAEWFSHKVSRRFIIISPPHGLSTNHFDTKVLSNSFNVRASRTSNSKWRIDWWRNFVLARWQFPILLICPMAVSDSPSKGKIDKNDHIWTRTKFCPDDMSKLSWVIPQSTPQLCLKALSVKMKALHARRASPESRVCVFIFPTLLSALEIRDLSLSKIIST